MFNIFYLLHQLTNNIKSIYYPFIISVLQKRILSNEYNLLNKNINV